ncbi:co-chaperone GroES [Leptolyngbya sp. 7M]|uniref:co-chaperone GroES n=1 Tax=Leptolyngbya sp. 7M TaxID=2812896 RepID=UPI001B8BD50D|nr:co-chaperone GroES [Leptolyngbya sp. 7M]QYO64334.1 hypothetical protein JVX88_32290 [Leptolyngbya sp. 7M]
MELPSKVVKDPKFASDVYGRFSVEPFERGFGTTIGNGLRRVLLSSLEGAAVTAVKITGAPQGIFLPETSKDKPKTGIIEAVGDGALNTETGERIPLTVKKGDRVIFSSYAGTEVKLEGTELLIMSEDDILAVID